MPNNDNSLPPLQLEAVGSFFIGGQSVIRNDIEVGLYSGGQLVINQMYVQYMVPSPSLQKPTPTSTSTSMVLIHGGTLSGASYETTPDGRMGWYEYFTRSGYPTYVVDQVGRGRSGFDHSIFNMNRVKHGESIAENQPNFRRVIMDVAWKLWRIGPVAGTPFEDSQFAVEGIEEFAKQTVPDSTKRPVEKDDPNYIALSLLSQRIASGRGSGSGTGTGGKSDVSDRDTNRGVVLVGHSQSGTYPFTTALLNPKGIKGIVSIEPGLNTVSSYTDEEITCLAKIPILIIFGDHLDAPQDFGVDWLALLESFKRFTNRINRANGKATATVLHLPEISIRGNSHMLMQDKNNLQLADLIKDWVERNCNQ